MNLIKTLQDLEPVFIEAGRLACDMQKTAGQYNKFNTGNTVSDIVTEADLAVQEILLSAMQKTELVNCRLLAEEDTPLVNTFNSDGKYYLAIDPIDDTAIYAKGGDFFSQIVSLHDGRNILYAFIQYPALGWTHRIIENSYSVSGSIPDFTLPDEAQNSIVFWNGNPEENLPKELVTELKGKGLRFTQIHELSSDVGSIPMYTCDRIAGVYQENMNAYDALTEYAIGIVRGNRVFPGPGTLDLTNIKERVTGLYYPGSCLALSRLFSS